MTSITFYQAFVRVVTPDYSYWNALSTPKTTRVAAEADVVAYIEHKRNGTGGFRKGAPGQTRIDERPGDGPIEEVENLFSARYMD